MHLAGQRACFCRRLLEARRQAGLSQRQLGVRIGLDEFAASARINRYEVGVHEPDFGTVARLASATSLPSAYLFADNDTLAHLILLFARLPDAQQDRLLKKAHELSLSNQLRKRADRRASESFRVFGVLGK